MIPYITEEGIKSYVAYGTTASVGAGGLAAFGMNQTGDKGIDVKTGLIQGLAQNIIFKVGLTFASLVFGNTSRTAQATVVFAASIIGSIAISQAFTKDKNSQAATKHALIANALVIGAFATTTLLPAMTQYRQLHPTGFVFSEPDYEPSDPFLRLYGQFLLQAAKVFLESMSRK